MSIRDMVDQFEIQGCFCIKSWNDGLNDCKILACGHDFEFDKRHIKAAVLDAEIVYMYVANNCLNIEIEEV